MCNWGVLTHVFPQRGQRGSRKSMEPARNGALTEIAIIKKQSHALNTCDKNQELSAVIQCH